MNSIVLDIQKMFVEEAKQSPLLFSDLASVEGYISESYSGRSLIELLQNADDAGAQSFYIESLDANAFLVANDGHPFTNDDFLALCRSGASTKKRKSNTIGFRGIGFKAVVNYASTVHLVSGEIKATFSKKKTLELLPTAQKVPLIRVPHPFDGNRFYNAINKALDSGYNTVFVFETNKATLSQEIQELSSSSLLFVNSIKHVIFKDKINRDISLSRNPLSDRLTEICITELSRPQKWIVVKGQSSERREAIAFKYDGQAVIEADIDEAVFHSFMPTKDRLSSKIKINGDFSTDPSRTRVVWDDESEIALRSVIGILADLFRDVLQNNNDTYGFINILKAMCMDPLWQIKGMTPNDRFVKETIEALRAVGDGRNQNIPTYIQPDSYDSDDFSKVLEYLHAKGIGEKEQAKIPGIMEFAKMLGYKPLPYEKSLEAMTSLDCSERTRASVFVDTIKGTSLGMSSKQKELFRRAKIVKSVSGKKSISEMDSEECLDAAFEGMVTDQLSNPTEYKNFMKRVGINYQQSIIGRQPNQFVHSLSSHEGSTTVQSFGTARTIHKWRSVEKNVAALLESMPDIKAVTDVSKQNIGYDLEAILENGETRYYEVKSVDSLGENFTFTNNEYSTAVENKNKYFFAITCQTEDAIEVCFISNPIDNLSFTKRAIRWEWVCSEYKGEVVRANLK